MNFFNRWLFPFAAALLAIAAGLYFQGSFVQYFLILGAGLWVGLPVVFLVALILITSDGRENRLMGYFRIATVLALACVLSLIVGIGCNRYQIRQARAFVDRTVPLLDAYQKQHGRFPDRLDDLGGLGKKPNLLAAPESYSSDGEHFRFEYWNPAGLLDGWQFGSIDREWTNFD